MIGGTWAVPGAAQQYACPQRVSCNQAATMAQGVQRELDALKKKIQDDDLLRAEQDARLLELETLLANGNSVSALNRELETRRKLQRNDEIQRRDLDLIAEENARLRQILKTNKFDMDAVEAILVAQSRPAPEDFVL